MHTLSPHILIVHSTHSQQPTLSHPPYHIHPFNSFPTSSHNLSYSERDCHLATATVSKSKNNGQPVFVQHREPMLPAVDPDKRIISPASRRDDREARYTLTVIFRHESSSSSSSSGFGGDIDLTGGGVDGEHRSKDAKHVQEFRIRRAEPIIEWGEKHINLALALQVNIPSHQPIDI